MAVIVASATVAETNDTGNVTTYASGSFTPVANRPYLLAVSHSDTAAEATVPTIATTTGLAFVQVGSSIAYDTIASNVHRLTLFRAMKPSGLGVGTYTVTLGDAGTGAASVLIEVTQTVTTGSDGANAIRNISTNAANAGADPSITMAGAFDSTENGIAAFFGFDSQTAATASNAAWAVIGDAAYGTPNTGVTALWTAANSSTAVCTHASADWAGIAVELISQPTPGAAQLVLSTTAPTVTVPEESVDGVVLWLRPVRQRRARYITDVRHTSGFFSTAVEASEANTITPGVAQLVLSTTAPTVLQAHNPAVGADDLILSTTAPVADLGVPPGAAQLLLSFTAPTVLQDHRPAVGAGNLLLSTTAPSVVHEMTVTPGVADLVLSTTAPDVVQDHRPAVGSSDLVLSFSAPEVIETAPGVATPGAAQLVLSTTAPTVLQEHIPAVGAGQLVLSFSAPVADLGAVPEAAQLTLSTTAPTVEQAHLPAVGAGQLVLSFTAPTVEQAHLPAVGSADLILSTFATDVTATNSATIAPEAAQLVLSTTAPEIDATLDHVIAAEIRSVPVRRTLAVPVRAHCQVPRRRLAA
jgi:hypothetical protein